jgi:hypothetical protein
MSNKIKWKYHLPVMREPKGLVHIIFQDDTEDVLDAKKVQWDAGWEDFDKNWQRNKGKKILSYIEVSAKYATEFADGEHRAIDGLYLQTSKLLAKKTESVTTQTRAGALIEQYAVLSEKDATEKLTVFHGTTEKALAGIKRKGLTGTYHDASWFLVSKDYESALFHAEPAEDEKAIVIEFELDVTNEPWEGFPLLWPPEKFNAKRWWYALQKPLPKESIAKVHKVDRDKWQKQKSKGF